MRLRYCILTLLGASGCLLVTQRTVRSVDGLTTTDSVQVRSPVRAHLIDGSTVRYPDGFTLAHGVVRGIGTRLDLRLRNAGPVTALSLDSVLGMESYVREVHPGYSFLATMGVLGGAIGLYCAADPKCFGSCPTFYSDSGGAFRLEAEGFSYSIAQLFESRDVDRLRATPDSAGDVRLEVRNEAYETHYLNHLELLEVRHRADEMVVPDPLGQALAVRAPAPPVRAIGRGGRDQREALARADGIITRTDPAVLRAASERDLDDTLDLSLPAPSGVDSVAVVLRLRNSLLNTVLLYDIMLGDRGARSLDWLGQTAREVGPALALGQWYAKSMGLRILVVEGDLVHEVARLRDTGPVAWKDIGILLPAPRSGVLHLRLVSVVDDWRIDRIGLGAGRHLPTRVHPLAQVLDAEERADSSALASMTVPDDRYLQTTPGQRFTAVWHLGSLGVDEARTVLLASQGYYIEWIRRGWLAAPRDTLPFRPGRAALADAVTRWRVEQDSLEAKFSRTRVPVR